MTEKCLGSEKPDVVESASKLIGAVSDAIEEAVKAGGAQENTIRRQSYVIGSLVQPADA
jgi:hypothetical protein